MKDIWIKKFNTEEKWDYYLNQQTNYIQFSLLIVNLVSVNFYSQSKSPVILLSIVCIYLYSVHVLDFCLSLFACIFKKIEQE